MHNPRYTTLTEQYFDWPINASYRLPQRERNPPPVAIDANLSYSDYTVPNRSVRSSTFSSSQDYHQSEEGSITDRESPKNMVLPATAIVSLYNDSSITSSPAAKRLRLNDSLEQPGPSVSNSSTSIEIDSHEKFEGRGIRSLNVVTVQGEGVEGVVNVVKSGLVQCS